MGRKMSFNDVKEKSGKLLEIIKEHGVIRKNLLMEKAEDKFNCKRRPHIETMLNYLIRNGQVSIEGENVCFEDNKNQKIPKEG